MIRQIVSLLERELGWKPVEDSDGPISYRVSYGGMEAAGNWTPEVRELYRIEVWVDERDSERRTQISIRDASRMAFTNVSELLNAEIVSSSVSSDYETTESQIDLIFRTIEPRSEW